MCSRIKDMKAIGFVIVAILATILSKSCVSAAQDYSDKLDEISRVYFFPYVKSLRSPRISLSGEGSHKNGRIRPSGEWVLYEDSKNKVIGTGFIEERWQHGKDFHTNFGIGGRFTHNLYKSPIGRVDINAGYNRQWIDGVVSDSYNAGITYSGQRVFFNDGKNKLLGTWFIDESLSNGSPFQAKFGFGAKYIRKLYDGPIGHLDFDAGFNKQWYNGLGSNLFQIGLTFKF